MGYENDPVMSEAIDLVLRDPELARWFAEQLAFDGAITNALGARNPPAELRTILLAGIRASRCHPYRRRRTAAIVGMAAALALACSSALLWWRFASDTASTVMTRAPLLAWQTACVSIFADPNFRLDLTGSDYSSLERHLVQRGTRVAGGLPFTAQAATPIGCKVLTWRGQPVSLVCFRVESGEVLHLFVVPRGIADEATLHHGPHHARVGEFATITWKHNDLIVMVASKMPAEQLAPLVAAQVTLAAILRTGVPVMRRRGTTII